MQTGISDQMSKGPGIHKNDLNDSFVTHFIISIPKIS